MRKITKKNLHEVASEIKDMMRDTHKNGVYMEIAVVWNKRDQLSLLDTFSAGFAQDDIVNVITYNAVDPVLNINKIMEMIAE